MTTTRVCVMSPSGVCTTTAACFLIGCQLATSKPVEADSDIAGDIAWYQSELRGARAEIVRLRAEHDRLHQRIERLQRRLSL